MLRILALCAALATSLLAQNQVLGRVVGVSDGDTITVLDAANQQHKVRLEGIDAPERGQAYGAKATEALKGALGDGRVVVTVTEKDRYGRSVGRVQAGQVDVNAWMIEKGWAWHYKAYSKEAKLAELEAKARATKAGLWADPNPPQAPWDYRAAIRNKEQPGPAGDKPAAAAAAADSWWLNTHSNVRHNRSCRYFGQTSKGRPCRKDEGKACGICGG